MPQAGGIKIWALPLAATDAAAADVITMAYKRAQLFLRRPQAQSMVWLATIGYCKGEMAPT